MENILEKETLAVETSESHKKEKASLISRYEKSKLNNNK